ncbi:MAG: hypothetical protein NWF03_04630 [Candidatus Bathyarchaeota archaeon]|nr:hypothetical protein [Candidatus Bathyarchaeota archaeon]
MPKRVRRLTLPFAVPAKDRFKPFTKDMEMAAIYYLTERDRKKGEGRVLKKPEEKILFIAETCYPIWLVPWKGRTLIFDGLGLTNQTIPCDVIPDIKAFDNDIQASSKSREAYCAALSQHTSYFQNFGGKDEITIDGLITNAEFTKDLVDYLNDAEELEKVATPKAVLSPTLDESEVAAELDELTELRTRVEDEIKNLSKSMKLLSKGAREQIKNLQAEIKASMKEFDNRIKKVRPKVMEKINKIQEKRDEEVTRISKKYDRKLRALHQNRVSIEKTLERISSDIERYEADIKTYRERKDEADEFELTQKLDEIKKKIPVLNREIKEIDRNIENVEDAKKIEVSRARRKPDDRIEEAQKSLHDIEAAKEARIRLEQQELDDLQERTSAIIKQIDTMIKTKETALNELDNLGYEDRRRKYALVYLSLYFVCYETEVGKRYVVNPPSMISSMGIKTKLKGVFGAGKMKSFMQSRSDAIAALLDKLVDLTQQSPVFEKEITDAGSKANILRTTEQKVGIKRGLEELKEEGWISENEFQVLNGDEEKS